MNVERLNDDTPNLLVIIEPDDSHDYLCVPLEIIVAWANSIDNVYGVEPYEDIPLGGPLVYGNSYATIPFVAYIDSESYLFEIDSETVGKLIENGGVVIEPTRVLDLP